MKFIKWEPDFPGVEPAVGEHVEQFVAEFVKNAGLSRISQHDLEICILPNYYTKKNNDRDIARWLSENRGIACGTARQIENSGLTDAYHRYYSRLRREWVKNNGYKPPFKKGDTVIICYDEIHFSHVSLRTKWVIVDDDYKYCEGGEGYFLLKAADDNYTAVERWEDVCHITRGA